MTFTRRRKRRRTRRKRIPVCSFSVERPVKNLPLPMRAADLFMWLPCTTAFPMRWSCRKRAIMPLRSSIAQARRRPARIWRGQSLLSMKMRKNWEWTCPIIPFGAALRARAWRHGLEAMEPLLSERRIIRDRAPSSCSIRVCQR